MCLVYTIVILFVTLSVIPKGLGRRIPIVLPHVAYYVLCNRERTFCHQSGTTLAFGLLLRKT